MIGIPPATRTIDCPLCGYEHQEPRPAAADVDRYYRETYYQVDHRQQAAKERRERWYWREVYKERLQQARRDSEWFENIALDVGAGCGEFLTVAHDMGWHIAGIEPCKELWTPGVMYEQILDIDGYKYDFIHCSLVLEHVVDPFGLLKQIRRRLAPGGVVCVVVPNERNMLQEIMGRRFGYDPVCAEHINYFTQRSIRKLMERAEFNVYDQYNTYPMERFPLTTPLNYVKHPWTGTIAHWYRMLWEYAFYKLDVAKLRQYQHDCYYFLAVGVGRETVVWGRAND